MDIGTDYFIPVRTENAPNPIETLAGANSQVQMDDIEYMQNKMFAAMRVPKSFLNFQEAQGKVQNLSLLDVRFARMINRIQQFLLMELNKIAMIHLYIMGMTDEIGNFTISLNNPSAQIEAQELDDLTKRITTMQSAVADPGNGIPLMSLHKALREIMKMSDEEIKEMLQEIRLEKAMAAELQSTAAVIKKTGTFDAVDRLYGDFDVLASGEIPQAQQGGMDDGMGGMGGGAMGGAPLPGDMGDAGMDLGGVGTEGEGDLGGEMGETDMGNAPSADEGAPIMEHIIKPSKKTATKSFVEKYFEMLDESIDKDGNNFDISDFEGKNATMEESIRSVFSTIDGLVEEKEMEKENLLNEAVSAISIIDKSEILDPDDVEIE